MTENNRLTKGQIIRKIIFYARVNALTVLRHYKPDGEKTCRIAIKGNNAILYADLVKKMTGEHFSVSQNDGVVWFNGLYDTH